ncbi:MAG: cupin domain-containing protein, partial [Carnobacterium sp.]
QYHNYRSEVWTIISGDAIFIQDGETTMVLPGDVLSIPIGSKHCLYAMTDTELIEVQMGDFIVEEDIVRLEKDWSVIIESIR